LSQKANAGTCIKALEGALQSNLKKHSYGNLAKKNMKFRGNKLKGTEQHPKGTEHNPKGTEHT